MSGIDVVDVRMEIEEEGEREATLRPPYAALRDDR